MKQGPGRRLPTQGLMLDPDILLCSFGALLSSYGDLKGAENSGMNYVLMTAGKVMLLV